MTDVSATLAERRGRYGQFRDHAKIAQGVQEVLQLAPNWSKLDPDMRQALCVISDKMARILNGDPYYRDNWHDIQGYAKLVENRLFELERESAAKQELDFLAEQTREADYTGTHAYAPPQVQKFLPPLENPLSGNYAITVREAQISS